MGVAGTDLICNCTNECDKDLQAGADEEIIVEKPGQFAKSVPISGKSNRRKVIKLKKRVQ